MLNDCMNDIKDKINKCLSYRKKLKTAQNKTTKIHAKLNECNQKERKIIRYIFI